MFASTARPTLPGVAAAPTTATDDGARTGRSDATAATWSRSSIRSSTAAVGVMSSDTVTSPTGTPTSHGVAGVLEHSQHCRIVGHHLRVETVDSTVRRDLRQLLEHPHPDPPALIIVSHGKRDLGDAGLAQPGITGDRRHLAVVPADQHHAIKASRLSLFARDEIGAREARGSGSCGSPRRAGHRTP